MGKVRICHREFRRHSVYRSFVRIPEQVSKLHARDSVFFWKGVFRGKADTALFVARRESREFPVGGERLLLLSSVSVAQMRDQINGS